MRTEKAKIVFRRLSAVFALAVASSSIAAAQANEFDLLVVGDSLVFGQGLLEKDKMFTHVAEWLRSIGRNVVVKMKAHSGSTLKFHADEAAAYKKAGRDETYFYKPEVNVSFPSTWKQLEVAADEYRAAGKAGADLILLSGCVTDISVSKVLDPNGDDDLLRRQARQYCHDDMLELLNHAVRLHPSAAIVVIGYFPMISEQSDDVRLFNSWLEARDTNRLFKWMMNNPLMRKAYFKKVGDKATRRSRLWFDISTAALQSAVADFNKQFNRPRGVFVQSPLTEDNAVEAPNTMLFRMGKNGISEDPMFAERKAHCNQALPELKRSTGLEYPIRFCEVAGVGHPNPTGSKKYADAIIAALPTVTARP